MKKKTSLIFLLSLTLAVSCAPQTSASSPSDPCVGPRTGCLAPDFTLTNPSGESFSLSANTDKAILLNFWASWCGPCKDEMPDLQALYKAYSPHGLIVFGVNNEDSPDAMSNFGNAFGLSFPLLVDNTSAVSRNYQIQAYPTSFFIDKSGLIFHVQVGSMLYEQFESIITSIVEVSPKPPFANGEITPTQSPSPQTPLKGCVTAGALNVRPSPSKEVAAIDWFYKNECYWFRGRTSDNQWLRLNTEPGWVSAKWIQLEDDISSLPVIEE